MSPISHFAVLEVNKKIASIVVVALVAIILMPIVAIFSLGQKTLSFLESTNSSDSTMTISSTTVGLYEGPEIVGDTYAWGNCTYWVYALRLEEGDPIPTTWGNASTWSQQAIVDGYSVDHSPTVGSIMQTPDVADGLGHVAYVTNVDVNTGTWSVSEMNVKGLDIVDTASYSELADENFSFIHDKVRN